MVAGPMFTQVEVSARGFNLGEDDDDDDKWDKIPITKKDFERLRKKDQPQKPQK
jgi:hypothetical protein